MAPEQARGEDVDGRTDIFAAGAVLFEMLSGRPAFAGSSAVEALHGVLHDQPPALVGSLAVIDADRVIQRALAKAPANRYETAEQMMRDLRVCQSRDDSSAAVARAATRLIVLPFRLLRPDPSIDFLAFSLPDAITVSLWGSSRSSCGRAWRERGSPTRPSISERLPARRRLTPRSPAR